MMNFTYIIHNMQIGFIFGFVFWSLHWEDIRHGHKHNHIHNIQCAIKTNTKKQNPNAYCAGYCYCCHFGCCCDWRLLMMPWMLIAESEADRNCQTCVVYRVSCIVYLKSLSMLHNATVICIYADKATCGIPLHATTRQHRPLGTAHDTDNSWIYV